MGIPRHDQALLRVYIENRSVDHAEVARLVAVRRILFQRGLDPGAIDVVFRHLAVHKASPDGRGRRRNVNVIAVRESRVHGSLLLLLEHSGHWARLLWLPGLSSSVLIAVRLFVTRTEGFAKGARRCAVLLTKRV